MFIAGNPLIQDARAVKIVHIPVTVTTNTTAASITAVVDSTVPHASACEVVPGATAAGALTGISYVATGVVIGVGFLDPLAKTFYWGFGVTKTQADSNNVAAGTTWYANPSGATVNSKGIGALFTCSKLVASKALDGHSGDTVTLDLFIAYR